MITKKSGALFQTQTSVFKTKVQKLNIAEWYKIVVHINPLQVEKGKSQCIPNHNKTVI